ncbi:HEPN domain-containing protein [Bacteroides acidifaciens]|uniref:HEPN domain-containing protein n=1 Tax=Bacteroides acidifaciens TaxID=85831 RepID=UPI002557DA95|nr:HEPN domain-containing protein [Bacteroides acidifaciens]
MNSKVYVNGGILVLTPYFISPNGGAKYTIPPKGCDIIEPNEEVEGHPCLIITETNSPSFFKEYYARTFYTTNCLHAHIFCKTIDDCFISFSEKINEIITLINLNDISPITRQTLYRLSVVSIVASLDTLVSDIILYAATKNRNFFLNAINTLAPPNQAKNLLERILRMWCDNAIDSAEQDVINLILRKSYSSLHEIKTILKTLFNVSINNCINIEHIIELRHLIAHRNGRKKDGHTIELSKDELLSTISDIDCFANDINKAIRTSPVLISLKAWNT